MDGVNESEILISPRRSMLRASWLVECDAVISHCTEPLCVSNITEPNFQLYGRILIMHRLIAYTIRILYSLQ